MNLYIGTTIKSLFANDQKITCEEYINLCNEKLKLNYNNQEIKGFETKIKQEYEQAVKMKANVIIENCINDLARKPEIKNFKQSLDICNEKLKSVIDSNDIKKLEKDIRKL